MIHLYLHKLIEQESNTMCVYICIIVYTRVCICWRETPDCSVEIIDRRLFPLKVSSLVTAVQLKTGTSGALINLCLQSLRERQSRAAEQSETGHWLSLTVWQDHGRLNEDDMRCSQHVGLIIQSWGGVIRYLGQKYFWVLQCYWVAQSDFHFISDWKK